MITKLYEHQARFVDHAKDKYLMAHACGTGKTITALAIAQARCKHLVLIICPKGVKSKWQNEVKSLNGFMVVTKEEFRRDWETYNFLVEGIIVDEAHHFSSTKSLLHKSLVKFIKKAKVRYIWLLTATPYRREPMNIYALAKILGHDWDFMKFRYKFYQEQHFGPFKTVWVPKPAMEKEVSELVHQIGDVVAFEECGDLPPIQHKCEFFELTSSQKKLMGELEFTEPNPLTFYLRQHQVCSGIGGISNKNEFLLNLLDTTLKLAIFCRYTEQIDTLYKMFNDAGHLVFVIDGRTKDKAFVADCAEKLRSCVILLQMDSSEGYELPSFSTIVFASMSYSYLAYEQSLGRFVRINKVNSPKIFLYLLTKNTIDEDVYENIMKKQDFSLEIYAKSKGKKI